MSTSDVPANVLLISDDPGVFDLRMRLAEMYELWGIRSVATAQKGLEQLESDDTIDAVVVGQRIADVDSRMLLESLHSSFPTVARIAIAQSSSVARALEAARIADGAIEHPVDVSQLQRTLERTVALRWRLNDPQLRRLLADVDNLPSPPSALAELSGLLTEPDVEIPQIAKIVETDPAMTAKLLQIVNSAAFGLPSYMKEVGQIIAYLGLNAVRNILTADALLHAFPRVEADLQDDVESHRGHAMRVAELAKSLPKSQAHQNDAYVAGMLHDVGLLALMSCAPVEYRALRGEVQAGAMSFEACELEVLGTSHSAIGAQLLENWLLPTPVVEAVARSHDADAITDPTDRAVHAVFVAEQVATTEGGGSGWWEQGRRPSDAYLETLGWSDVFESETEGG